MQAWLLFILHKKRNKMISAILRSKTKAFADWKAAGGSGDVPASVVAAADAELQGLKNQGYSDRDILEGKAVINYNNGNGGNAGGPNKMLLIGGAIAAVALLVLVLRK